jgi:poly(A) polymerase
MPPPEMPADVLELVCAFRSHGRDAWIVGGHVRDLHLGRPPRDLDLATDATPAEQERVYARRRIRRVATGAVHGTFTAILGSGAYQVTSLKDAALPSVRFGRDLARDLGLRDLTVNAMAMDAKGATIDPHGGREDLAARRIRFSGDPGERIREDAVRVLRWMRFHLDLAPGTEPDRDAARAAGESAAALSAVPRERVWGEVSRTLSLPDGAALLPWLARLGLDAALGLPPGDAGALEAARARGDDRPETLLAAYLGHDEGAVLDLAASWRWSGAQRDRAAYVARHVSRGSRLDHLLYVDRHATARVAELARATGRDAEMADLAGRPVPVFPVRGRDLRRLGLDDGAAIGEALDGLRRRWADSGYALGAEELMGSLDGAGVNRPVTGAC